MNDELMVDFCNVLQKSSVSFHSSLLSLLSPLIFAAQKLMAARYVDLAAYGQVGFPRGLLLVADEGVPH